MTSYYGMFSGCACCPEINVCDPKHAEDGIGDVSIQGWGYAPTSVTDRENPAGIHYALLHVTTTHAGVFIFVFQKNYDRTFHIPTVEGRSPAFWDKDKYYFDELDTVSFSSADLTVYYGSSGTPLIENSPEDDLFREAFGGLNPFDVMLTVFPITLGLAPPSPGEVDYPTAFSIQQGIPPLDAGVDVIEDHIESSWANLQWFWGPLGDYSFMPDWGHGFLGGSPDITPNDALYFMSYTHHRRGYTFLPSGLGPLDTPINQFGHDFSGFFPPDPHPPNKFAYFGVCYPYRLNDFIASLTVTILGVEWDFDVAPSDEILEILNGINGTYVCEWADTNRMYWMGRNAYWIMMPQLFDGSTLNPVEASLSIIQTLTSYETVDADVTHTMGVMIHSQILFNTYKSSYYGDDMLIVGSTGTSLTYNAIRQLPGVGSYTDGDFTYLYLTDPAAYVEALGPFMTWAPSFDDPF
jgi:hypothetical protein